VAGVFCKAKRRQIMQAIRRSGTAPEVELGQQMKRRLSLTARHASCKIARSSTFPGENLVVKPSRKELPLPTEAELAVLNVLWDKGPVSVREVHDELAEERSTVFNTTLRVMQRMAVKGLIIRDESRKPQRFQPRLTREQTQTRLVGRLMNRAFGGSARTLVLQALRLDDTSAAQIARIEELLDCIEGNKGHGRD